jgi:1-phosphofructokinase
MKIATVTLNPAIDQTVSVDNFQAGTVNRSLSTRLDAGGKGVNVASFLADYGMEVAATGFLGEENAELFERHFARKKIEDCFIRVPGETRVNIKIMDEHNQETTDLNTPGKAPGGDDVNRLSEQIEALAESCEWIVLSGNLPPGLPSNFYSDLIQSIKRKNQQIVLDTSGDALLEGLKAGPCMIKPNVSELSQLTGREFGELTEIHSAARSLLNEDVQVVVISMGGDGALFIKENESLLARPPSVTLKSTVGAGDAMVAGLVAGSVKNLYLADCARLATAFSISAITRVGRDLHSREEIESYQKQIVITPFEIEQS